MGPVEGAVTRTAEICLSPWGQGSGHLPFSSIPAPVGQPPAHLYLLWADKEKARELALLEAVTVRLRGRRCATVTARRPPWLKSEPG